MNYIYHSLIFIGMISSFLILLTLNPISKLGSLVALFLWSALLMIQLEFYFLGLTYLIVYIGAICILFLFVIMMLETHPFKYSSYFTLDDLIVSLLLLVLVFSLMYLVYPYFNLTNLSVNLYHFYLPNWSLDFITFTDLSSIGLALYIAFPLILIILSLIFWVVLIGVLSLHS